MSTGWVHSRAYIACDSCSEVLETEAGETLADLWNTARAEKWTSRKIGGDWINTCAACSSPFGSVKAVKVK